MAEKKIYSRITQKHDTSANWTKNSNFIPYSGEIIIYEDLKKIKIGDGVTSIELLPFARVDGKMTEKLIAFTNNEYTTSQVRNSILTSDTSIMPTENGAIVWYYK